MKFRPCIDIHNGKVKQIIGGSLADKNSAADENFVSEQDGGYYARLYKEYGLFGGHVILLNPADSPEYRLDKLQAQKALSAFPQGLQIGGGITVENAEDFLRMGASHVIVTSYVFREGRIDYKRLRSLVAVVGREHLVLDLSCRKRGDAYYIVTDRWQNFTTTQMNRETVEELCEYCDEFLIHAVDVEGKQHGIEENVAKVIGKMQNVTATYAGGISSFEDLKLLSKLGKGKIDFTIGSALDIFGGNMKFEEVAAYTGN